MAFLVRSPSCRLQLAADLANTREAEIRRSLGGDLDGRRHGRRHNLGRADLRASMLALTVSSLATVVQMGFIIGVGLLLDTFIVRTITVPAVAVLIGTRTGGRRRRRERC